MYLSRLLLDVRRREVQHDLGDVHATHQRILSMFPQRSENTPGARAQFGLLYRVDQRPSGPPQVLIQSRIRPHWEALPLGYLLETGGELENPACKPVDDFYAAIASGMVMQFRLRANPTRRIDTKSGPDGVRRNGKRVELKGEEQWLAWLTRKGEQHGFDLQASRMQPNTPDVQAIDEGKLQGRRSEHTDASRLTLAAVRFDGRLTVRDSSLFREALASGIGSGKAYGFGLLSVARAG